jgi:hypothetical protein
MGMKLYFLLDEKRYVHRQSDIPKGARHETRDIPTDLAGLMAHLNEIEARNCPVVDTVEEADAALAQGSGVAIDFAESEPISVAAQQMRQLDVEDAIQRANPVELNAYATNVFDRFKDLMKEKQS